MRYVLYTGTREEIGGKAHALARIGAAELPVPDWFVIPPAAFLASLSSQQRDLLVSGQIEEFREDSASLRVANEIAAEIATALNSIGGANPHFAVRSSAIDEDGAENSFAGQLESYLFVERGRILEHIVQVWRSGFSERLIGYRRQRALSPVPPFAPAVLIQRMIDADAAGVAFSADPVTGRRGTAVINAVYGLGTALVSGEADADTFYVDRSGTIRQQSIATKLTADRFDLLSPSNIQSQPVAEDIRIQPVLSSQQTIAIASLARRAASIFGQPQDIEWAIQNGVIYLLQSRPITSLRNMADPDGPLRLWDSSNITESYNGVTLPLTFSFARSSYESVYRQFCRMLNVPRSRIETNRRTFRNMLGLIHGRVYYNLLNWYHVLALLPGYRINRRFMEQMMGVREALPDDLIASGRRRFNIAERTADACHLCRTILGLLRNYLTLDRQIANFQLRLDRALAGPSPSLEQMRLDELIAHYEWLQQELGTRWDAPLSNDFFAMIFHGLLRKLTAAWCDDASGALANQAVRGHGAMISTEPAARIKELAAIARNSPHLVMDLCEAPLDRALESVRRHPQFRAEYEAYLARFGDRCMEELKLESETLHENPTVVLRSIGTLARAANNDTPHSTLPQIPDASRILRDRLSRAPVMRAVLMWVLRNAAERVRQRENLRFQRTRLFGRIRQIFLEAGKRLHAIGQLDHPRDIFYLEAEESVSLVDGTATTANVRALVQVRKEEFSRYRELPPPPARFETREAPYFGQSLVAKEPEIFPTPGAQRHGLGCCPGVVCGPVRVVRDPQTATIPPGSILVADHTDPGWVMLFPSARGLLVERGGLLSHAAIVARELGIPAVVSIPGLTDWLHDGDLVELDGSEGTVRRIDCEAPHAQ